MKMKIQSSKNIICMCALVIMTLFVTSCVPTFVKKGDDKSVHQWRKAALVETMITPPESPTFPLIQAGIYKSNLNELAPQIIALHKERIDKFSDTLGEQLNEKIGFELMYGKKLLKHAVFKNIEDSGIKTYPATLKNEEYNALTLPERGYNFFNFSDEKNPYSIFNGEENTLLGDQAGNIAALCKALEVDGVIVSMTTLETVGVDFLARGGKRLVLKLTFFDRTGKLLFYSEALSPIENSSGGDFEAYKKMFDKYPEVVNLLLAGLRDEKK